MKLLCIGDVVGEPGLKYLSKMLPKIRREYKVDFTIVNGENSAGVGILPSQADSIFSAGADIITLGNHVWNKRQIIPYLEDRSDMLRPANLAPQAPGIGYTIMETAIGRMLVINLIGRCEMAFGPDNPFLMADKILKQQSGEYDFAVCEIHAAATSEKLAMGYYLDGKVSAVWGTHTHVPTADARINPKGTGYITDVGMTGPKWSVLGIECAQSIALFRGDLTESFKSAEGPCIMSGVLFEIDNKTKQCVNVTRIEEQEMQ